MKARPLDPARDLSAVTKLWESSAHHDILQGTVHSPFAAAFVVEDSEGKIRGALGYKLVPVIDFLILDEPQIRPIRHLYNAAIERIQEDGLRFGHKLPMVTVMTVVQPTDTHWQHILKKDGWLDAVNDDEGKLRNQWLYQQVPLGEDKNGFIDEIQAGT